MPLYIDLKIERYLKELSHWLHALDLPRRPAYAGIGTSMLGREILRFSHESRLIAVKEFAAEFMTRKDGRQGRIDWLLRHRDLPIRFAVEIDRANKQWSLEKLVRAQQAGFTSVWIRWRNPIRMTIPEQIYLIDLTRKTHSK